VNFNEWDKKLADTKAPSGGPAVTGDTQLSQDEEDLFAVLYEPQQPAPRPTDVDPESIEPARSPLPILMLSGLLVCLLIAAVTGGVYLLTRNSGGENQGGVASRPTSQPTMEPTQVPSPTVLPPSPTRAAEAVPAQPTTVAVPTAAPIPWSSISVYEVTNVRSGPGLEFDPPMGQINPGIVKTAWKRFERESGEVWILLYDASQQGVYQGWIRSDRVLWLAGTNNIDLIEVDGADWQAQIDAMRAPTAPASGTNPPPALRIQVIKLNSNDDPSCITVGRGAQALRAGTYFKVDGSNEPHLRGTFSRSGDARICGLARPNDPNSPWRQEVTISFFYANGNRISGGAGVPAKGGDIFVIN
jgi:hypothetical protein